jgi:hypothetical protein
MRVIRRKLLVACFLMPIFAVALTPRSLEQAMARSSYDPRRDFDFELGNWKGHFRLLKHRLSGSQNWASYGGKYVVYEVLDGRAVIGELTFANATSHVGGVTLRLYDPSTQRWNIYFASNSDGRLGPPSVGRFENGRGEFRERERFDGRTVYVQHVFSDITPASFRYTQSFSINGGRTWEKNWIAEFTRS